jgi:hypothetical protein
VQSSEITPISKLSSESTPFNNARYRSDLSEEGEVVNKDMRNLSSFEALKANKSGANSVSPSPAKSASKMTTDNLMKMRKMVKNGVEEEYLERNSKFRSKSLTDDGILACENLIKQKIQEQFPEGFAGSQLDKSQSEKSEVIMYTQHNTNLHPAAKVVGELITSHFDLRHNSKLDRMNSKLTNADIDDKPQKAQNTEASGHEKLFSKLYSSFTGSKVYPRLACVSLFTLLLEFVVKDGHLLRSL